VRPGGYGTRTKMAAPYRTSDARRAGEESLAVVLMTSSMKLDIRVVRAGGGAHLARSVDEMDLPWLSDLVAELRREQAAVVTLTDPDGGAGLVVRVDHDRYRVERMVDGVAARLARIHPALPDDGWSGPADDHYVDLAAARQAIRCALLRQDLAPGLRWHEQV
jgi:hypothetical protein